MSRIGAPMTDKNIDDFFQIGKQIKIETVPRSTLGGKNLDPKTGKAAIHQSNNFVAPYKRHARHNNPNQTAYAQVYQREEEEQLRRNLQAVDLESVDDDNTSTTTGAMERLESLSMTTGNTESTITLPKGKTLEEANEVYTHYNFRHDYNEKLAIFKYRKEILDTVESNQVTVIQGQTGCGKTTQVPQYILDSYALNNRYCNIVVTQPRRIAAISIARRICHERNWPIGNVCGYQVGMDKTASDDTRLIYCTTGVLLQKLIGKKDMQDYTHVILDEVHERDQETDFTLLVVRKLLRSVSPDVKVVLMSATIDCSLFASYFAVHVRQSLEPAPILEVEGKTHEVKEFYLEDLRSLGELPRLDPSQPKIDPLLFEIAKKLIMRFDGVEMTDKGKENKGLSLSRGSVLCFLPGLGEINDLYDKLREIETPYKLKLIPLHSTITADEQARVFDKPGPGQRKVIMSTNIAESSITVPDIKYVVDFCLTKNLVSDVETGYTSLQLQWASRANCKQRRGRAGRVSDGRVYRLVTRNFYEEHIEDYSIPEMKRCPLDIVVLKAKQLDLGEPKAILGLALSPPGLDDIEYTILRLKEIGALASLDSGECNPHDGELTFLGRVLADLPLDIRLGKLILLGHVFGFLEECIIISASLSNKSFFSRPYKADLEAFRKKFDWADESFSDCLAYLNAYVRWVGYKNSGMFPTIKEESRWARDSFIQLRRIKDVADQVEDLKKRLSKFNIRIPFGPKIQRPNMSSPTSQLILKVIFCGAFYPNYFLVGHVNEEEATKDISGHNPYTTVMVRGLPPQQGNLYKAKVAEIFKRCDARGQRPKVHCEETKAYIEFVQDPMETGSRKIVPAMYLALKMRQLRLPMDIRQLDPVSAREQMDKLSQLQMSTSVGNCVLRSNRLDLTATMEEEVDANEPKQVALPASSTTTIKLGPTMIVDCGTFWCHYADEETTTKLSQLQEHINMYRGTNLPDLPPSSREVGTLCLAPYNDGSTPTAMYYRARIEKLSNPQQMAHVFFVDYGNVEAVPYHTLRDMESHFRGYPLQAFKCQLAGIKPSAVKCVNGRWTEEARNHFRDLVHQATDCFGKVYSIVHNVVRIELFLQSDQRNQQENINQRLIDKCFADAAEEDYLSKQNHRQREEESLSSPTAKSSGPALRELGEAARSLIENDLVHATNTTTFVRKQGGGKFNLIGPISPYEMHFYSMTNVGRLRTCKVDRDSLNSIALDDEPHTPYKRMMVAAYLGLNPSGSTMMARDTTLLPNIPGLPALMCMLFTPTLEIRTDPQRKRFTGALCGLGWDPDTGGPALGDHDMEVSFDTVVDLDDLITINNIRMGMNLSIGSKERTAEWGQDMVLNIQENVTTKLMELIKKRREVIPEATSPFPYQWNLIDPVDIRKPCLNMEQSYFLTLHNCVQLVQSDSEDEDEENKEPAAVQNGAEKPTKRRGPTRTDYLRDMREHIHYLHKQASRSNHPKIIRCNLCDITTNTSRQLMLHLQTKSHKKKEAEIQMP